MATPIDLRPASLVGRKWRAGILGLAALFAFGATSFGSSEPNSRYGDQAYEAGRYQEAIGYYGKHLNVHGGCSVAYGAIGRCYYQMKDYPRAADYFSRALASNNYTSVIDDSPALARAKDFGWRAKTYVILRNYAQAALDFQQALRAFPADADYLLQYGQALTGAGRYKDAIAAYSEALRNNASDGALVYYERGRTYFLMGEQERALEHFDEAIRMNPTGEMPYVERLIVLMAMGRADLAAEEAEQDLNRAAQLDRVSQYMALYGYLAYRQAGNPAAAAALLRKAAERCDQSIWPFPLIRFCQGDLSSRALYDRATDNGKMTEAQTVMAFSEFLAGQPQEARKRLQWIAKNGDRSYVEYDLAVSESRLATFAQATTPAKTPDGASPPRRVVVGFRGSPSLRMPGQRPYKNLDSSRLDVPDVRESNFADKLEDIPSADEILKRLQEQGLGGKEE